MEKKTKADQVEPVTMVAEEAPEPPWLPSAKQMLMATEKARFEVEGAEREAARKFVQDVLYPLILEESAKGQVALNVAHKLTGGVLRHVIAHLKEQGYAAEQGPLARTPTLIVGWGT